MDLKKIGIALVVIGIALSLYFMDNFDYFISTLTIVILGFFIGLLGFLDDVKKAKIKNDRIEKDIENVIQPLVTKYSNLNKEFIKSCSEEEYVQKRIQMNQALEKELGEKLPYLNKKEIKNIVIEVSHNQESL